MPVARALQEELEHEVDAKVWDQGVFGLSDSSLEALERHAGEVDFAVFVLTADDLLTKRGESGEVPRDNVLFEAGLFIGRLGRHRAFLVSCRDDKLALPTDLRDITRAQFNRRANLLRQLLVQLRWAAFSAGHQFAGQQTHRDAVLVGRPGRPVLSQQRRTGAFLAAKAKRSVG